MMPDSATIRDATRELANQSRSIALAWHVLFAAAGVCMVAGWRPLRRELAALTLLPLLTVMNLAWITGNAFTALALLACSAGLVVFAAHFGEDRATAGSPAELTIGALLIAIGWGYPHFLDGGSWTRYLYEAPLGVVPCATLAFAAGVAIAAGGFASRGWSLVLAAATAYYGLVGVFVLGVTLDLALVAGALTLIVQSTRGHGAKDSATRREFSHHLPGQSVRTA